MSEHAIARRVSALPAGPELNEAWKIAKEMIGTGFLPKAIDTPQKAIAVYLKGRELGIPFMASMAGIHIIEGKPTMSANAMLGVCYRDVPGFTAEFTRLDDGYRGVFWRNGAQVADMSFTRKDAERAGLLGKGPWQKYFDSMCLARVQTMGCRVAGPDALMGVAYTPEELGAEVDEEGAVIAGPSPVMPPAPAPVPESVAEVVEDEPQAADGMDAKSTEAAPSTDHMISAFCGETGPAPPPRAFADEWKDFENRVRSARTLLKPPGKHTKEPRIITEHPEGSGKIYLNNASLAKLCGYPLNQPTLLMVGGEAAEGVTAAAIVELRQGVNELLRDHQRPNYAKKQNR